jgi:hypothetical protein
MRHTVRNALAVVRSSGHAVERTVTAVKRTLCERTL